MVAFIIPSKNKFSSIFKNVQQIYIFKPMETPVRSIHDTGRFRPNADF